MSREEFVLARARNARKSSSDMSFSQDKYAIRQWCSLMTYRPPDLSSVHFEAVRVQSLPQEQSQASCERSPLSLRAFCLQKPTILRNCTSSLDSIMLTFEYSTERSPIWCMKSYDRILCRISVLFAFTLPAFHRARRQTVLCGG